MDTEIKFRVDTADKVRFERKAESERRSLSDWIRVVCLEASGVMVARDMGPPPAPRPGKVEHIEPTAEPVVPGGKSEGRKATPPTVKDTRTPEEKRDDFYRANMAKGKR